MNKVLTIGDLCNIATGKLDSNACVEGGKYPFFTCAEYPLRIDSYDFEGDVVMVAGNNASGNFHVNRYSGKFNAYQRTYILMSNGEVPIDHVYYVLKLALKRLKDNSQGSQTKFLTIGILRSIPVVQNRAINRTSSFLSSLDAKIDLNNRVNKELEAMAKTLYDYWFVQFDFPISAEQAAVMGQPGLKGKPYKSSGGKMVWNKELKREIPEGWEVKELAEITSLISRGISPKYLDDGGSCVINQKCVRQGTILYEQARRNDENQRDSSNKRIALFDILVNSTGVGTLGRVSMVRRLPEQKITVDSHVTIVRVNEKLIHKLYFGYTLLQKQLEIERFSLGSTGQVELSRSQLETIKVILPSVALQNTFEKYYRPICEQLANNEEQNQQLASLRDWLLPMLMNGQVKVGSTGSKMDTASEGMDVAAEPDRKY